MASYGIKYILTWISDKNTEYRIEVLKRSYSGESTVKKLGAAPVLIIDNADNGIKGTSLQFAMQADSDGELNELYATDGKLYKVRLYSDGSCIWSGFLMQELYSEMYIAPPYDVDVTATDQLALLKNESYVPFGQRVTLLQIIDKALQPTQLELSYAIQSSLKADAAGSSAPFISYTTVDDSGYVNKTCYDILSEILTTCNMTICEIDNVWQIVRVQDITGSMYKFSSSLTLQSTVTSQAIAIGDMASSSVWPVGSLMRSVVPVIKSATFSFSPIQKMSYFNNPRMIDESSWIWSLDYIYAKPQKVVGSFGSNDPMERLDSFVLRSTQEDKTEEFALWQTIHVDQATEPLKLQLSYVGLFNYFENSSDAQSKNEEIKREVKLVVRMSITSDEDDSVKFLTTTGWKETPRDLEFTGTPLGYQSHNRRDKTTFSTATVNFPAFPITGMLTISFRNDSSNYRRIKGSSPEYFYSDANVAVTDVYLTSNGVVGYDTNVVFNNNGLGELTKEFSFSDAYMIGNEDKNLYNFIKIGENNSTEWSIGNSAFSTFFKAIIQDTANLYNLKNKYTGVICGKELLSAIYLEKFSQNILRLTSGTVDLLRDELSGEWEQIVTSNASFSEYEIVTNDGNVITISGDKAASPLGNYVTADAFQQFKDLIDSFIGLDDDGDVYIKMKNEETPRNLYGYGEISSGGKGESDEDAPAQGAPLLTSWDDYIDSMANTHALSAGLGKALKDLIGGGGSGEIGGNYLTQGVANTLYSPLAGSNKITTVGAITSGTWNGAKIANAYLANSSISIAGTSVSLGGSISVNTLRTRLDITTLSGDQTITGTKTFGSQIVASAGVKGDLTGNAETATRLLNGAAYKAWGQTFFENGAPQQVSGLLTADDGIKIGNATIIWDAINKCLKVSTDLNVSGEISTDKN